MTVIERMCIYQKSNNLSDYAIEKALGKSKGYWHTCKNPTAGIIQLFLETFPDLSAEWLLRGEGEMLRTVPGTRIDDITKQLDEALGETRMSDSIIRKMIKEEVEKEVKIQLKKEA